MIESKVEVKGFEARHYDFLLQLGSFRKYGRMLKNAVAAMNIRPEDAILDMGCGTGKNSCLMAEYLEAHGRILGLDIGDEMIAQFTKKCAAYPNINVEKRRIDEPLPYHNEFKLDAKPFWFRIGFKKVECPLAFEYITGDWKSRLREKGFDNFREQLYFMDTIRLLIAHKSQD